jgi:hypothetical protein
MMSTDKPSDTQTSAKTAPKAKPAPLTKSAKVVPATKAMTAKTVAKPKVANTQPVTKTPAKTAPAVAAKAVKIKKPKLVRDSLTMPKGEYEVLDLLKSRAATLQSHIKKTELIRAGIKALAAMTDVAFLAAIKAVPNLKTGRPKKS